MLNGDWIFERRKTMLNIIRDRWDQNKEKLRNSLATGTNLNSCSYIDLVKLSFEVVFNSGEDNKHDRLFLEGITEIDNGDYQGTLLYLIPFEGYQPSESEYLMTYVGYGSCSGCDTLQAIQNYSDEPLTERQVSDFMILCKDILTNTIKPDRKSTRLNSSH